MYLLTDGVLRKMSWCFAQTLFLINLYITLHYLHTVESIFLFFSTFENCFDWKKILTESLIMILRIIIYSECIQIIL